MNSDELISLHVLALEKTRAYKNFEITRFLKNFSYSDVGSFSELRQLLISEGQSEFYPDEKSWNYALSVIEKNHEYGINTIPINTSLYPSSLKQIDDPPSIIHIRGNIKCFDRIPGVAVVGSRKVTKNGKLIAKRISAYLADNGWCVVSGLALGVDAAAHEGALSVPGEGNTIAVLAHGLDHAKPQRNSDLAMEIINKGGLWVSEHPVGIPAKPEHFVPRNRIQLGLASGSIIIEAEKQSGTITQAKFCIKQHRPLFAVVPHAEGNPLKLLCSGTEMLVEEMGAIPIKSKADYESIIEKLSTQRDLILSMS